MTGSDEAGRRRKPHVRVVAHANDLTFASTKTELKRMRSKMSGCYDVKVRGILGNGRRDVREIQIIGGNLRWTDQGLEQGASDEHREAQMEGMGLNEESQMVNSASVKLDQIGQEDDEEMVEGTEETRFTSLAARLNYITVQWCGGDFELHEPERVGRAMRCDEHLQEDGESDTRKRLKNS